MSALDMTSRRIHYLLPRKFELCTLALDGNYTTGGPTCPGRQGGTCVHHQHPQPPELSSSPVGGPLGKDPFSTSLDKLVQQQRQVCHHEAADVEAEELGGVSGA